MSIPFKSTMETIWFCTSFEEKITYRFEYIHSPVICIKSIYYFFLRLYTLSYIYCKKKFRIWETPNLSNDADRSTDTN